MPNKRYYPTKCLEGLRQTKKLFKSRLSDCQLRIEVDKFRIHIRSTAASVKLVSLLLFKLGNIVSFGVQRICITDILHQNAKVLNRYIYFLTFKYELTFSQKIK
jgi:hypothetical protein